MRTSLFLVAALALTIPANAQRKMMHPGISYTQADLDRMRAMVEAKQEPFYSGFLSMRDDDKYTRYHDIDREFPKDKNGKVCLFGETLRQLWLDDFGKIALNNALLWHITGDTYYANRSIQVLNRYIGITSTWSYGTNCLDNASASGIIEAAELMRDYEGWKKEDQDGFKAFLVHPGYTTLENYYDKYHTGEAETNNVTIYWNILNGDTARHGNQGLYGMRTLLAMGIYLDNDTIYDRAMNKLLSRPHRTDDLPYPGESITPYDPSYENEYARSWDLLGRKSTPDYGADDELKYWIYENGQCQEAARDQGHIQDGMCNFMTIARSAWNQGDDIYTQYDDRLLKGLTYTIKYNYGWLNKAVYNEAYWQGEELFEPTAENGQFLQLRTRNKRMQSLKICPYRENGDKTWSRGKRFYSYIQPYIDYKVRVGRSDDSLLWVRRAYEMDQDTVATTQTKRNNYMLTDYRTAWMAGDGGTFNDKGLHVSGLPKMPGTIKAVDYDFYNNVVSGNGHTYYNPAERTDQLYRHEGGMQIAKQGDDYVITNLKKGSWMSYTVIFPKTGYYDLTAEAEISNNAAQIGFAVDGSRIEWNNRPIKVQQGARVIRVYINGADDAILFKGIKVAEAEASTEATDYVWNSRDYQTVANGGVFLTDQSAENLYSTSYSSTTSASFNIESTTMNYLVPTTNNYLVVKGKRLNSGALRQAIYRLSGAITDVTKKANTPQTNHKTLQLDNDTTVLVWKLDSSVNARIKPVFDECYKSTASTFTLRGMSIALTGSSLHLPTSIDEIMFYDQETLYSKYPKLNPETTDIKHSEKDIKRGTDYIYDLQGRRISSPKQKGIYIKNGKKLLCIECKAQ